MSAPPALVLARHGQTEWNLVGRRQGQLDSPLTSTGVETARRVARVLEDHGIDVIVSSSLGRARQTAAIFAEALDVPVIHDAALAEVHHGEFAGLTTGEIEKRHPEAWAARGRDFCR